MSLSDLNNDILKLIALKIDTKILVDLFIYRSKLSVLCHNEVFWSNKLHDTYPEYGSKLVDRSHIKTLLALDRERIWRDLDNYDNVVIINANTTMKELSEKFGGGGLLIKSSDELLCVAISKGKVLIYSSHPTKLNADECIPIYMISTHDGNNLYLNMSSIETLNSRSTYLISNR